ncbi:MAG TPA: efflux RND transporter permease subunit, partial [Bryobacteraceae bacterium]|nr:efflux RND transporter permease subunit [Bryobacteraceae bacterium]
MNLPHFSIRRPVTTLMVCLIAILLGAIAFINIPVDLMPEIVYPTLSVSATYEGVAPEEMENLVTRPLEQAFAAAPGVEEITSTSSEGSSSIRVSFTYGTDLDEAANELRSRLDRRRGSLPEDMDPPVIYKFDVSQFPIMFLSVASPDMDPRTLRQFVEKNIQYRLERVPGVAQFSVRGGLRREIHVDLDLNKLRGLDMPVSQIVQAIQRENVNLPVGQVSEGRFQVLLRTQGEFQDVEQLRGLVIAARNGVPIYLRDVALVEDSTEEINQIVSVDGNPAVRLFINKQSGANTVEVSDGVKREIERIHRDYPNVRVNTTMDSADFIRASIQNVRESAIVGSLLAVVILLFFLRSFASTVVIGVSIPIAVIATFALMYFSGFTLNTVSFGGLALGVGMLVDNAIVVLENIFRHREQGSDLRRAAVEGSSEVSTAVTASTLTTVAVFVPVVFMAGMSGQTFKQLAYVVSFSLLCSLLVALTIVPVLAARILRQPSEPRSRIMRALYRIAGAVPESLAVRHERSLAWAINHRATVVFSCIALLVAALLLAPTIGVELQPEVDEGQVRADVELEPGTRVEVTDAIMQRLGRIVREKVPEADHIMIESGEDSPWRGAEEHT